MEWRALDGVEEFGLSRWLIFSVNDNDVTVL